MNHLHLDCFSGVSGNMLLGALIDLGYAESDFQAAMIAVGFDPNWLHISRVERQGLSAVLLETDNPPNQPHRHLSDIEAIIDGAELSDRVKSAAKHVFRRLAESEAKVHGSTIDHVHFHEVGAVDAIIDIVGVCHGIETLGIDTLSCSPLPLGSGTIQCAHGILPVPVPATVNLLDGVPTYSAGRDGEHVTPTGAALVTTLCESFGPMPAGVLRESGYGAGTRTFAGGPPNLLRAMRMVIPSTKAGSQDPQGNLVIETNIDDMNPEFYGPLATKLFSSGALDVTLTPCYMKKGRPGVLVSVITDPSSLDSVAETIFAHSTTIGLRTYPVSRIVCQRDWQSVDTAYGPVRMKISRYKDKDVSVKPEFDDCKKISDRSGKSVQEIYNAALAAYFHQRES